MPNAMRTSPGSRRSTRPRVPWPRRPARGTPPRRCRRRPGRHGRRPARSTPPGGRTGPAPSSAWERAARRGGCRRSARAATGARAPSGRHDRPPARRSGRAERAAVLQEGLQLAHRHLHRVVDLVERAAGHEGAAGGEHGPPEQAGGPCGRHRPVVVAEPHRGAGVVDQLHQLGPVGRGDRVEGALQRRRSGCLCGGAPGRRLRVRSGQVDHQRGQLDQRKRVDVVPGHESPAVHGEEAVERDRPPPAPRRGSSGFVPAAATTARRRVEQGVLSRRRRRGAREGRQHQVGFQSPVLGACEQEADGHHVRTVQREVALVPLPRVGPHPQEVLGEGGGVHGVGVLGLQVPVGAGPTPPARWRTNVPASASHGRSARQRAAAWVRRAEGGDQARQRPTGTARGGSESLGRPRSGSGAM